QLLIEKGADVNKKDIDNNTALMWAAWYNHPDIVRLLINAGASLDDRDNIDQKTALGHARKMATEQQGLEEVIQMLEEAEAAQDEKKRRLERAQNSHATTLRKQQALRSRKRQVRIGP